MLRAWTILTRAPVAAVIACVEDPAIADLNHRYRRRRGPTDVLTFVYKGTRDDGRSRAKLAGTTDDRERSSLGRRTQDAGRRTNNRHSGTPTHRHSDTISGDIVIALGMARRQARARGVAVADELRRLAVHGLAHLAGYDHRTTAEFSAMRVKEFAALCQIL